LEAAAEKADYQESIIGGSSPSGEVVGPSSKELESSGSDVLEKSEPLIKDISEYLLLHHNYSAKPIEEGNHKKSKSKSHINKNKLKSRIAKSKPQQILPKVETVLNDRLAPITTVTDEVLYGTFDEATNCITINVNDDSSISDPICEMEEDSSDKSTLKVPLENSYGGASPASSSSSGYESHGSPESFVDSDTIWDDNVSELFPSLM